MINAYNRIYYDSRYDVPTYAGATAAQLVILKKVNGEMAYYLAQHLDDEDRRMGLRNQGVIKAGIVKEDYKDDSIELPVPPFIDALLDDASVNKIASVFWPEPGPDEDPISKAKETVKQARQWTWPKQYRRLLMQYFAGK